MMLLLFRPSVGVAPTVRAFPVIVGLVLMVLPVLSVLFI